jgi:hypothetical protein
MAIKNICKCDDPPGGSIECEPHQMAVCGIINGAERRVCEDPPSGGSPENLVNWALSIISGESRQPNMPIGADDLYSLKQGHAAIRGATNVKFTLPQSIIKAIDELESKASASRARTLGA